MDTSLPKSLRIPLENLMCENVLSGWTIHGSEKVTTVILRFKMEDTVPDQSVKYRRISPSQIARDSARSKGWIEKNNQTNLNESLTENEIITQSCDESKHSDTIDPGVFVMDNTIPDTKPVSPRITRSKSLHIETKSCSPKSTPSPVQQTDGLVNNFNPAVISKEPEQYNSTISNPQDIDTVAVKAFSQVKQGVKTFILKRQCLTCMAPVDFNDLVQCCFLCKGMFCRPCILKRNICKHRETLHRLKPLSQYMDNG